LVVNMQSPDRDLRERLYGKFLRDLGIEPTGEMIAYLGDRAVSSVREMIGTANRLAASAEVKGVPVTMRFVREELEPEDGAAPRAAVMAPSADTYFLDREKIIWQWPDPSTRMIEENR